MNNKYIIPIIVGVLILGGVYFYVNKTPSTQVPETTNSMIQDETVNVDNMMQVTTVEMPEGALKYTLAKGSTASYTVQKRFLTKEDAVVTGTTEGLTGEGWIHLENKEVYLNAQVQLDLLKSDSEKRDEDLMSILTPSIANIEMGPILLNSPVALGQEFSEIIPLQMTINGTTNTVDFDVTATVTETGFEAVGEAKVLMTDFGVTPPSLLDVYNVDNETVLNFNVVGTAL